METANHHLMQTYARLPVSFTRGVGAWLWDTEGNRYLDALGGISVAALGHSHPQVAAAVSEQAHTLMHTSNLYEIPLQRRLAERLCAVAGMDRAFFCNSGAEANEAAIKLARLWGHRKGVERPAILVMDGAFHGRTLATLTATGNRKVHAGFEPLVSGFKRVPFNDLDSIRQVSRSDQEVVAVLVEPIQGEGGINIPDAGYLAGLRQICDQSGWLLMIDEIQTGMCRTGRWFAYQHEDVVPDVVTVAKALGNGVPIGACMASGAAADVLGPGSHGSTFGGNPLACRAALAVIEVMHAGDGLAARAAELGLRILRNMRQRLAERGSVLSIRGRGLMMAVQTHRPCAKLVSIALQHGLLINVTAGDVVRLLPPLILADDEADLLVDRLLESLSQFESQPA